MKHALAVVAVAVALAAPAGALSQPQGAPATVTVDRGDTLSTIARDWPGGWTRAAHVNGLTDPDLLEVGQVLVVPTDDGPRWVPPRPVVGASRYREPEAADPTPVTSTFQNPESSHDWYAVAACESGGNWSANTGNGYYGGLQFSLSSWQAVGGTGYPHEASASTQIAMGERLLAVQGSGAWPKCGASL